MEGVGSLDVFLGMAKTMAIFGGTVEEDGQAFEWMFVGEDG